MAKIVLEQEKIACFIRMRKIYSYYTNALLLNEAEVEAGAAQLAEQAKENYASDPDRYDYDLFFWCNNLIHPGECPACKAYSNCPG